MNKNISTNFLLLKDYEQKQIIQHLSKDVNRKELYNHFLNLYNLKINFIKNNLQKSQNKIINLEKQSKNHENNNQQKSQNNIIQLGNKSKNNENIPILPTNTETQQSLISKTPINIQTYLFNFLVQEKLSSLVKNKNIALIGPANYLLNIEQGNQINNYDIIIRFNSGIISNNKYHKYIGNRTDIWIYNFKDLSLLDKISEMPKLIFCPYPKRLIDNYEINKQFPKCQIEFIEENFYYQLQQAMKFEPNSALLTILILLRQNIQKLYVSGLSFMYDGYYDSKNNQEKNKKISSGTLIVNTPARNNFISILKKIYNVNSKLLLDNTIINLIYPNFITVLNQLFHKNNHQKLFSTLNYTIFVPTFQSKYNSPNNNSKIFVNFGNKLSSNLHSENFHLIIQSIKPKMFANEVFVKNNRCDYDDLENLLKVKNKGIIYFSNNQWNAIDNMIPKKNRNYILSHHCYVNGNIYGSFIKYIAKDFDISENELYMLYVLFALIYYGQKIVYVNQENVHNNGMSEVINVMKKLNLIKYIS